MLGDGWKKNLARYVFVLSQTLALQILMVQQDPASAEVDIATLRDCSSECWPEHLGLQRKSHGSPQLLPLKLVCNGLMWLLICDLKGCGCFGVVIEPGLCRTTFIFQYHLLCY